MKITLVNLNLVTVPAIAPYALDVLGSSLEAEGHEVEILDLCPEGDPIHAIHEFFDLRQPTLVGLSMRNAVDMYFPSFLDLPDKGSFIPSHKRVVDAIKLHVGAERIIIGGAGFSVSPRAFLRRLDLRYGVRGPGEVVLCELMNQLPDRRLKELVSGAEVFVFDGERPSALKPVKRTYVDNAWYYNHSGQAGIRTTTGCPMQCSYCVEPAAIGASYRKAAIENVLTEIEQLMAIGIRDFHAADSEFNMPLAHSKELLRAIIQRHYGRDVRFWAYCQPRPFDEEYTDLLARAGVVGINFGTDHTDDEMLRRLGKWYKWEHIAHTTKLCKDNGIAVMHELVFGSPGDTPDKMYRAIEDMRGLEPWVIGITIGLCVLPGTPLCASLRGLVGSGGTDRGLFFAGEPMVDPSYYVAPAFGIPEIFGELSRYIGPENKSIMFPQASSTSASNNQLVNSERVRHQLLVEQRKGPSWYHFPDR